MVRKYKSPYHTMLSKLIEEDSLNDTERNLFDVLATTMKSYTIQELVRVVLGWNSKSKGRNPNLELEISDAIDNLQHRAIPIVQQDKKTYYLADKMGAIREMIATREKEIEHLQHNLKVLYVNYGRQIDLYRKLTQDEKD